MKSLIARTLLLLTLLLVGSAIFAVSRSHLLVARPVLIPKPGSIPSGYFGMTLHNYRHDSMAVDSFRIFAHLGHRRALGRYSSSSEYLHLV